MHKWYTILAIYSKMKCISSFALKMTGSFISVGKNRRKKRNSFSLKWDDSLKHAFKNHSSASFNLIFSVRRERRLSHGCPLRTIWVLKNTIFLFSRAIPGLFYASLYHFTVTFFFVHKGYRH